MSLRPKLGCGNGNLDWDDVRPVMEHYLNPLPIKIYIHDFTKNIGLPEHLEVIAQTVRDEVPVDASFDAFVQSLHRVVDLGGDRLVELGSEEPMRANFTGDAELSIEANHASWTFEEDVLRGVWLELQSGLVTRKHAGWAAKEAGMPLLSILSMLPGVRPIEIQRPGAADPEFAIERTLDSRSLSGVQSTTGQAAFQWH